MASHSSNVFVNIALNNWIHEINCMTLFQWVYLKAHKLPINIQIIMWTGHSTTFTHHGHQFTHHREYLSLWTVLVQSETITLVMSSGWFPLGFGDRNEGSGCHENQYFGTKSMLKVWNRDGTNFSKVPRTSDQGSRLMGSRRHRDDGRFTR